MYFTATTLDDLLRVVFENLLKRKERFTAHRGTFSEIRGATLKIANPRARLSRSNTKNTLFSALGELLWYLSRDNELDFITYYIPKYHDETEDNKTVDGGYGPRMFSMRGLDQVENVISVLRQHPESRRAVIQLFNAEDVAERKKEIPCTCTLQFMIRKRRLEMLTHMRSNDAYIGLPHDVFAFTMIQEIFARALDIDVGPYRHTVGSLHLYEYHFDHARKYVEEGYQASIAMPPMPLGDQSQEIEQLLKLEKAIRKGRRVSEAALKRKGYWADLARLLQIFKCVKKRDAVKVLGIKRHMTSRVFDSYIRKKEARITELQRLRQMDIPFSEH